MYIPPPSPLEAEHGYASSLPPTVLDLGSGVAALVNNNSAAFLSPTSRHVISLDGEPHRHRSGSGSSSGSSSNSVHIGSNAGKRGGKGAVAAAGGGGRKGHPGNR